MLVEHTIADLNEFRKKMRKNSDQVKQHFRDIVRDFSELKELSVCIVIELLPSNEKTNF